MATLPFRGLAERGILHDPSPYQLDMNAWSNGTGMRFHANKATRAPIWRTVVDTLPFIPLHCVAYRPSTGYDVVFLADNVGRMYKVQNAAVADVSAGGHVDTVLLPTTITTVNPDGTISVRQIDTAAPAAIDSTQAAYTSTFLGDVTYINRPTDVPQYYGPLASTFAPLPNWDLTWRCRSLRAFGSYLIALNVTKGTQTIKTLVKWSDLTLIGQVPGSWDATDPTKNAGENPLQDMDTPIVDGLPMRNNFIIYGSDQIWAMTPVASQEVFTFRRLFSEGGLLAPNCVTEVDGKHYVFGPSDIYVHDGTTKTSLIDQRDRDYVYRNLNVRTTEVCFTAYDPALNEITFAYQSGESGIPFASANRCNKGAVYNIPGNTWSFIDLPNVSSITRANLDNTLTYHSAAVKLLTPANIGGSYYDQDSGFDSHVLAVSSPIAGVIAVPRFLAYDFMNRGTLAYPYEPECNSIAYLERTGISLDQVGSDLTTYKVVRRVFPQVVMYDNVPVQIQIGGSLTPSGAVTWGPQIAFNPVTQYKIDVQKGGRYIAIRFTVNTPCDFEINGFDLDVDSAGRR